jgi:hypothetical protein
MLSVKTYGLDNVKTIMSILLLKLFFFLNFQNLGQHTVLPLVKTTTHLYYSNSNIRSAGNHENKYNSIMINLPLKHISAMGWLFSELV